MRKKDRTKEKLWRKNNYIFTDIQWKGKEAGEVWNGARKRKRESFKKARKKEKKRKFQESEKEREKEKQNCEEDFHLSSQQMF